MLGIDNPMDRLDSATVPAADVREDGLTDRQNGDVCDTGNTALFAHGVGSSSTHTPALLVEPSLGANRIGSLLSEPCCCNAATLYLQVFTNAEQPYSKAGPHVRAQATDARVSRRSNELCARPDNGPRTDATTSNTQQQKAMVGTICVPHV